MRRFLRCGLIGATMFVLSALLVRHALIEM